VCGSDVAFVNVTLGGAPTSQTCGGYDKCQNFGPKCDKRPNLKIDAPLGPPSPVVKCLYDGTLNQIVTYRISGGTAPYQVTFACTGGGPIVTENRESTGLYNKTITQCIGNVTVTVKDSRVPTSCSISGTAVATACCFNDFKCKTLPNPGTIIACDASNASLVKKLTFLEVVDVNDEACLRSSQPFSFSSVDTYSKSDPKDVCPPGNTVTRTYTAVPKDATGNADNSKPPLKCNQTWIVLDNVAPDLKPPNNITAECGTTVEPGSPTAPDNCPGTVTITLTSDATVTPTCSSANGFVKSIRTRTWTAKDKCNNLAGPVTQTITIKDTLNPFFTGACAGPLADATIPCFGTAGAPDPGCTGSDVCGGATVAPSCCLDGGKLKRKWVLTDGCGRTAERTQNVVFGGPPCQP
jgi:hypothetical protein